MDASALAQIPNQIPNLGRLTGIITAVGGLGTAAYGLVDTSKAFLGGVSNRGFANIEKVMATLIPDTPVADAPQISTKEPPIAPVLSLQGILVTLKSNWVNGMASEDQRAIAKTLVKLRLRRETATVLANATGVDATILGDVAAKIAAGSPLTAAETDVYGRFDLILTTLLDQAYQRGDQQYRNTAKVAAVFVSIALALIGAWALGAQFGRSDHLYLKALLLGLLATPVAPVAKDLASSVQAGAKAVQAWTSGA